VVNKNGKTFLENVYQKKEFISSSDMNFRPVNTATGPDGNLYVVDMHRGIIQQANWTKPGSFLRDKIDSIGLAKNVGHGRIYRVVQDKFKPALKPKMLDQSGRDLLAYLGHPNGWWRDNAQKEIIARGDKSVIPDLIAIATNKQGSQKGDGHLARIHALWTLEGLDAISKDVLTAALKDEHPQVRRTAIWISEPLLKKNDEAMIKEVANLKNDKNYDVRVQLLLSLNTSKSATAKAVVKELLDNNSDNEMITATKTALDKNEDVRTFGNRLGALAPEDRTLVMKGAAIFKSLCASCHGADAKGLAIGGSEMAAPPLVGSKRLAFTEKNMVIRILLGGLTGPVDGKKYSSVMPSMEANSDEWIASIASYIRHEYGGRPPRRPGEIPGMAPPPVNSTSGFPVRNTTSHAVTPEEVKKLREDSKERKSAWTLEELEALSKKEAQ